jgi:hypothetical protein
LEYQKKIIYDPNGLNVNLAKITSANEIMTLSADAPGRVTVAVMMELLPKRMIVDQTVHTDLDRILDLNLNPNPNLIPNPSLLIKKVVLKNYTDAAKTVQQQDLVLKEWFQYLIKKKAALNRILRHHNLVCMVRVPVANSVAVQIKKRMPLQNHAKLVQYSK